MKKINPYWEDNVGIMNLDAYFMSFETLLGELKENEFGPFVLLPLDEEPFEINANTREIISNYEEPDILISRSAGEESIYIYYTDTDGIKLQIGNAEINISKDKTITIKSDTSKIVIPSNGIVSIGKGDEDYEQAVLGNKLYKLLADLQTNLAQCASLSLGDATPLKTGFNACASAIDAGLKEILSDNVKIN
jgi:hypothetical protein